MNKSIDILTGIVLTIMICICSGCSGSSGSSSNASSITDSVNGLGKIAETFSDESKIQSLIEADTTGLFKGFVDDSGAHQDANKASNQPDTQLSDPPIIVHPNNPWWYRSPAADATVNYTITVTGDTALTSIYREQDWFFILIQTLILTSAQKPLTMHLQEWLYSVVSLPKETSTTMNGNSKA